MARVFTPKDVHVLMNSILHDMYGQNAGITVVDSSTFISAGEKILTNSYENILNSLSTVINRTLVKVRPYNAKLNTLKSLSTGGYSTRVRKIRFYSRDTLASGDYNTDLFTNFSEGYDNGENGGQSTKNMWEQHNAVVDESFFGGSNVYEYCITIYEDQLKDAFQSESSFSSFISGIMTKAGNDMEHQKEARNRMALINHIGAIYDCGSVMKGSKINLTRLYNDTYGTSFTTQELLSTQYEGLLELFVATFKQVSDKMTDDTVMYHWPKPKSIGSNNYVLTSHTPKSMQKAIFYNPFFINAEATVMPQIFNDKYLSRPNAEFVNFWQNPNDGETAKIKVTPAVPDIDNTNNGLQKAGDTVNIPYMLGILFDNDGLIVDPQFETTNSTPLEARKRYRNQWSSIRFNIWSDVSENAVIFYMEDEPAG